MYEAVAIKPALVRSRSRRIPVLVVPSSPLPGRRLLLRVVAGRASKRDSARECSLHDAWSPPHQNRTLLPVSVESPASFSACSFCRPQIASEVQIALLPILLAGEVAFLVIFFKPWVRHIMQARYRRQAKPPPSPDVVAMATGDRL